MKYQFFLEMFIYFIGFLAGYCFSKGKFPWELFPEKKQKKIWRKCFPPKNKLCLIKKTFLNKDFIFIGYIGSGQCFPNSFSGNSFLGYICKIETFISYELSNSCYFPVSKLTPKILFKLKEEIEYDSPDTGTS